VLVRERVAGDGDELGDVERDELAQGAHGGVVATGLAGQGPVPVGGGCVELSIGGVGLGGAASGLDPDDLQIGERGAELLLWERVGLLELAQDGHHLVAQPALLGMSAQEQTDIRGRRKVGIVGHARHPCSMAIG
jgi:hypothetical protein